MKTTQTETKYVEWLSAEVMHNASRSWLSELLFNKDEQLFFNDLIKSYTLQLLDSKHFKESKSIIDKLSELQKNTNMLIESIRTHENDLKIMVDAIDQLKEEESYKKEHRELIIIVNEFFKKYRVVKTELFNLIKNIIREQKQKRLLE